MRKYIVFSFVLLISMFAVACNNSTPAVKEEQAVREPFSYEEIISIFDMKESDVLAIYGEPNEIIESPYFEYGMSIEYDFGDNRFGFVGYEDQEETYLYFAYLADNLIHAPRDIQIGDDLETVLAAFPMGEDETRYPLDGYAEQQEAEYQLLYGEYMYMEQYAIMIYQQDEVVELEYADQGAVMRLHIRDDKLVNIEYMVPLA